MMRALYLPLPLIATLASHPGLAQDLRTVALTGDFNDDQVVDGSDFLLWQRGEALRTASPLDLSDWEANFGTLENPSIRLVPEPATGALAAILAVAGASRTFRSRRTRE